MIFDLERKLYLITDLKTEGSVMFAFFARSVPEAFRLLDDFCEKEKWLLRYPDDYALVSCDSEFSVRGDVIGTVQSRISYFEAQARSLSPEGGSAELEQSADCLKEV